MTRSYLFLFWLAALFWLFCSLLTFSPAFGATLPNGIDVGQTYKDPTFGTTVRRLSNVFPRLGSSLIYSINGLWNADGTRYASDISEHGVVNIIDAMTGATIRAGAPFSPKGDSEFDPVNPDIFYHFSGSSLMQYSLSSGQSSVVKTFSGELGPLGGSVDFLDRTGRYFLLNIGGQLRVWDKQTDIVYSGSIPVSLFDSTGGWAGISPDGEYVVVVTDWNHISYKIDNVQHTLSSTGVLFWAMAGGHSDLVSLNGKTYEVTSNSYDSPDIYLVDVSLQKFPTGTLFTGTPHFSSEEIARQKEGNVKLFTVTWNDSIHISCARKSDVCFISVESVDDNFTDTTPPRQYKSEILRVKVAPPYMVEELAKHRSLTITNYTSQPRVNSFWDGSKAMFASNFGYNSGGVFNYSDIYAVEPGNSITIPPPYSLTSPASPVPQPPLPLPIYPTVPLPIISPPAISSNPILTRTLMRGMRNADVVLLQQFLFTKGLLASPNITGYFGSLTRAAVERYQCRKLSICSGTEFTTGYGQVGPRTRTTMAGDML